MSRIGTRSRITGGMFFGERMDGTKWTIKRRRIRYVMEKGSGIMHRSLQGSKEYAWLPFVDYDRVVTFPEEAQAEAAITALPEGYEYKTKSIRVNLRASA